MIFQVHHQLIIFMVVRWCGWIVWHFYIVIWNLGENGHSNVVGVVACTSWKIITMFNNFVVTLLSSPLLLDSSGVAIDWYEFSWIFSFVVVKIPLGPNFPTTVTSFNGRIPQTLNFNVNIFSFYKVYYNALSTHFASVILSCSKDLFFAIAKIIAFLNAFLNDLK